MTLLTVPDLAARLQVSEATVRGMLAVGSLPGFRLGRLWRVDLAANITDD